VFQEFGLIYSTIHMIWKSNTKIISVFDQEGSRIKLFREPEQSDVMRSCLKWFKWERSDNVPVSGGLLRITKF
jgi:hypothetical protein